MERWYACMDEFTRKFNTAEDKDEQIHHILLSVYEALKENKEV